VNSCLALLGLVVLGGQSTTSAQCPAAQNRVLLVGDSWTEYMWNNRNLKKVLDAFGHGDKLEYNPPSSPTDQRTAIGGMTAALYNTSGFLQRITDALAAQPSIDLVHVSLGGNDMLGNWNAGMSPAAESALFDGIVTNLGSVIQHTLDQRPNVRVVIAGYDYLNFFDTLNSGSCGAMWALLGSPSVRRFNDALALLEAKKRDLAASMGARVVYSHHLGLMQFWAGYPPWFGAFVVSPPGGPPSYSPFPGGNPDFPTHTSRLANNGTDCIHLNSQGYDELATATFTQFYASQLAFAAPTAQFRSAGGTQDGFVSTNTSGVPNATSTAALRLGENADNTFVRSIVSFDTASLPDNAVVTAARVWLTRSGGGGLNPFTQGAFSTARVDIQSGDFSGNPALEIADFSAPATAEDAGCVVGTAPTTPSLLRIDLSAVSAIHRSGRTQLRIYFPGRLSNLISDHLTFYDGDDANVTNRPLLEVDYYVPTATATLTPPPTPTPSASPSASPSQSPSASPSASPSPSPSLTPVPSSSATPTPSSTQTATHTPVPTASFSSTPTASVTATASSLPSGTDSVTPTVSPTSSATETATSTVLPTASLTPTNASSPSPTATAAPACTQPAPANLCIPGGGPRGTDCRLEVLVDAVPSFTQRGIPKSRVYCVEGDPTCDADSDPQARVCGFEIRLCINNNDPRFSACVPGTTDAFEVRQPRLTSADVDDLANLSALEERAGAGGLGLHVYRKRAPFAGGAANSTPDLCSEPLRIRVPLRRLTSGRLLSGRRRVQLRVYGSDGKLDTDSLIFLCLPPA
jgi:lysophospholipase L1-like esterase